MRLGKSVYVSVMAFLFFYLVLVSHAQAYVDPGSASPCRDGTGPV